MNQFDLSFHCLGKNPADDMLDSMMAEAPGPINFTMFLTMFGDKLNGTDPEDVIKNAFACFDEDNKGGYCSFHFLLLFYGPLSYS